MVQVDALNGNDLDDNTKRCEKESEEVKMEKGRDLADGLLALSFAFVVLKWFGHCQTPLRLLLLRLRVLVFLLLLFFLLLFLLLFFLLFFFVFVLGGLFLLLFLLVGLLDDLSKPMSSINEYQ